MKYCRCEKIKSVHTDTDDWGQWDVCDNCNKEIEGTYQDLNHFDGEDHTAEW